MLCIISIHHFVFLQIWAECKILKYFLYDIDIECEDVRAWQVGRQGSLRAMAAGGQAVLPVPTEGCRTCLTFYKQLTIR